MTTKQPDWEAIERAYRAGSLSIRTIAERQGVSDTAIRKKAKVQGWARDLSDQVRKEVRSKLVRGEVRNDQGANCELDAEIIEEAAEEGARVVRSHRRDIRKATNLANLLMDDLLSTIRRREEIEEDIEAETSEDNNGMRRASMLAAVSLPSNSKTLFQLSSAMKNLQVLERQAYSLDEKEKTDEADELSKMMDELSKDA
ncbi:MULTISPECIES: hypothetical protein [Pseudomonas]|jgi:hypothetical protein|uniref:Phage-like protein n=1 Tax=Pseudomonas fluorescens TaxID=294 RepID=A0A2N1E2Y7_PSEFL|nr:MULTISPECIES: hypothetical protein [Pseudomonas]PKH18842.1 hypothetical protein CIB54_17305 [Pseudomonas fluorescens]TKK29496.1 hypothetical protein PspCFBP13528_17320 [Pseudomonas sp. CFBP13528]UOB21786.1 hypothetical protein MRY17_13580 [Pseudomonas orientalis]